MLHFITHNEGRTSVALLLAGWGRDLKSHVQMHDYSDLLAKKSLPLGNYLFTGLERLGGSQLERLAVAWATLREADPSLILANHPLLVRRRYPLLRLLYDRGINNFNVYRPDEMRLPERYPVFLRHADDHEGPMSELLDGKLALQAELSGLTQAGVSLHNYIITEYTDTRGEDGIYRKYGAFLINGEIIPRHMQFSEHWMVKSTSRDMHVETLKEELTFVTENPHATDLKKVFALANIDYGRIDYALDDGAIRVFEINTNPQILNPGTSKAEHRQEVKALFAQRFLSALRALCESPHNAGMVELPYPRKPWHKRRRPINELLIRMTNRIGLKRFQPEIYYWLRKQRQSK